MGMFGSGSASSSYEKTSGSVKQLGWQEDALKDIFGNAMDMEAYGGDRVAGWNPYAQQGMQNLNQMGQQGQLMGYNQMQQGLGLSNNMQGSNDFYNQMMSNPGMNDPYAGGPDSEFLDKYTNNPAVQAQIDAAAGNMTDSYQRNQRTGNASNATSAGGSNSSRRHMMDSLGQSELNNNIGDMSSGMRMNMLNQGLGAWENGKQLQNQNMWQGANAYNNNGMYGNELMNQGFASGSQGAMNQMQAGQYGQQFDQAGLDNEYAKYNSQWENLMNQFGIVGKQSWGTNNRQETFGASAETEWGI